MRIDTSQEDGILTITINRPEVLNAWDMDMQAQVTKIMTSTALDDAVEAVVFTGAGDRAFCAGQDLAETGKMEASDVEGWLDNFRQLYASMLSYRKPVVAALNGVAAGSGYQFALLCDVRVAHDGVRMGQTEVSSGIPSITGMYLTNIAVGSSRMLEMMLTGRLLDAQEAHDVGLVHHIVAQEDVMTRARAAAREMASQPKLAVALTKQRFEEMVGPGLWDAYEAARPIDERAWGSGEPQQVAEEFLAGA